MEQDVIERLRKQLPLLNEKQKRAFLAIEAEALGRGGASFLSKELNVSRDTIRRGAEELKSGEAYQAIENNSDHIRKEGAGRKAIEVAQPGIIKALDALIEGYTFGNPENPLRWTSKSLRKLQKELEEEGFTISFKKVGDLLISMGYSLQLNQKMLQVGSQHPDRDAQFKYINESAKQYLDAGLPVISVDCKKKELIGNFKNVGAEYAPKHCPVEVLDHDFPLKELGKAAPYGIYDIKNNEGYVNVGISSDTAEFAVSSIRDWWIYMGRERYPDAKELLITADGGGSNGSRVKLWKTELQKFANEMGLTVKVCHFPPGTSKWNKIEHRMFSQITKNWRGRPLESLDVIVNLIASTKTETGLSIQCGIDNKTYNTGIKVSQEELDSVNIEPEDFHGDWNYKISPKTA